MGNSPLTLLALSLVHGYCLDLQPHLSCGYSDVWQEVQLKGYLQVALSEIRIENRCKERPDDNVKGTLKSCAKISLIQL